ncbi:MAG: FtsQ-type POTRA domain-containing protein [Pseudomonadota bacterium]
MSKVKSEPPRRRGRPPRKQPPQQKPKPQEGYTAPLYPGGREVRVSSVIFGFTLITATLVAGAAWMGGSLSQMEQRVGHWMDSSARSMGFAIEHIVITGVSEKIDSEIRNVIMIEPGENMFRADPQLIRERVESTRLVMNVRVNRYWPNRVIIVASPLEPVALMQQEQGFAAIDSLGGTARLQLPEEEDTLLKISGAGAPDAVGDLISALAPYPGLQAKISQANRIANRRWDIELASGHMIRFPDDVELDNSLKRLEAAHLEFSLLDRDPASIDLRAEERIFIQRRAPLTAGLSSRVKDG